MRILSVLACLLLFFGSAAHYKALFFEIDDVLFWANETHGFRILESVANHYRNRLFEIASTVKLSEEEKRVLGENSIAFFRNVQLPPLWCLYLTGQISNGEVQKRVAEAIDKQVSWVWPEYSFLHKAVKIGLNPEAEAELMVPLEHMQTLINNIKHHNPTIDLYIFSNKNESSLRALRKKYPECFAYFKGVFISGHTKVLKPHAKAYRLLLKQLKLKPHECIIIDSQSQNLSPALQLGIKGLLVHNRNIVELTKELHKNNIKV